MRALVLIAAVGCGGQAATGPGVVTPPLTASGPPLPPPPPAKASARGAAYLDAIAVQLQPAWGQFLEDCRLRLAADHPLNRSTLTATAELVVADDGRLVQQRIVKGSGNGDFDTAVFDVLGDASPLPKPPAQLKSDDQLVHVQWTFARDGRQAGAATAAVMDVQLPLLGVVERLVATGKLVQAAQRVAASKPDDPDRLAAAEKVAIAALEDGLASSDGTVRRLAAEAVRRAHVTSLAAGVQRLVFPTADTELQIAAINAAAAVGDPNDATAPLLLVDLATDLAARPRLAIVKAQALATLGRSADVQAIVRAALGTAPHGPEAEGALAILGVIPDPQLAPKLAGWFARGDVRTRSGVCSALPAAAATAAPQLILRGLRDGDATVRATCIEAAVRLRKQARSRPDASHARRVRELVRDRDIAVRARATAAIGFFDPGTRVRAFDDAAPAVRAAAVATAGESELRVLASDRDADVRAAAIAALGDRSPELAARAAADSAPQVRAAAVAALVDGDLLERLAQDDSPDVATAALVKLAARRGRAAVTTPFLARLADAPAGGKERVRIALAWLLAR